MCLRSYLGFLFVALLVFGRLASAADYTWTSPHGGAYDSAVSACEAYGQSWSTAAGRTYISSFISGAGVDFRYCNVRSSKDGTTTETSPGMVTRSGTGCTPPKTYNATTGKCDEPPPPVCQDKPPEPFSKSGNAPDGYMQVVNINGQSRAVQSTEGCFNGCLASTADQKCTTKTNGAYLCRGTAYFSGQECDTTGTPGVDESTTSQYPEPETTKENEPCNYTTQADGSQTCTSKDSEHKEGQNCGTVNGQQICLDKPPLKDETQIDTTVATTSNADGTTTTTKTDTATSTKCTGINACTSNTTTTTTTTQKDGAGSTTSVSSSCTGARCPDENTNPDGNGDGLGDCVGGDCGGGEGGFGGPEFDEVDDYQTTTQKFFTSVQSSPLATAVTSISVPQGGTAPDLVSSPLAALGGASVDLRIITDLKPVIADVLSAVMKAFWCFVALMIFLMG